MPQRHLEYVHVAALKLEDRCRLQEIHVGGGGVEQGALLRGPQHLASGEYLSFCLTGAIGGLEAVEQCLGGGQPERRHRSGALVLVVDGRSAGGGPHLRQSIQVLLGQAGRAADARAIACERGWNVLVGGASGRALSIELGIVQIGLEQSALNCA